MIHRDPPVVRNICPCAVPDIASMRQFEKGKVSIVTPCYNGERFLDRYFNAIYDQTYDKIELIFVNDERSSDNSERTCFSWKAKLEERGFEFRYILQKKYKGVAGAINEGLPYVTGEFLTWPDCDDTLMPKSIEKKVEFLDQHPDYAMVRSDFVSVDEMEPDVIVGRGSDCADITNEDIFDNLIFEKTYCAPGCYLVRSAVLFKRIPSGEIYWENGGGQNWQLLIPCSYKNKTGYINEPLYRYIIRSDSHSHRIEGDKYSCEKLRLSGYHEILRHVINDFALLSDNERADYLNRIAIKYSLSRLNLAFRYNNWRDAKKEIQALERMNIPVSTKQKILYPFCRFGLLRGIISGYSSICHICGYLYKSRV